jgi:phosphatidylglycerophosphate synthase
VTSIANIRKSFPQEKNRYDLVANPAAFFLARPASYFVAWGLIKGGVSANGASILSTIVALAACAATLTFQNAWITTSLVLAWLILDCADGNIARATKTGSKYGEFLDALSGYILAALLPLCVAFESSRELLVMSAVAGLLTMLPRLLLNKIASLAGQARSASGDTGAGVIAAIALSIYNYSGTGLLVLFFAMLFDLVAAFLVLQLALGLMATVAAIRRAKTVLAA